MFSSAYPDIKLNYPSVSPCLSEDINDYLVTFNRLHKLLLEVFEKVTSIYNMAATDLISFVEASNKKILEVTKGATKACASSLVLFLNHWLAEVEKQASSLRSFQTSLQDSVVKPLRHVVRQKKEMWKTCFRYADAFAQQICKQETGLQKSYKQYTEAALRVKPGNAMERQFQIFHDSHNTYVLKWTSVNSIHTVFYTHVLPHIMHTIETNHDELNNYYRHHLSNLLFLQNNTWNKIIKSGEEMQSALSNLNFLQDLQGFIKLSNQKVKDKYPALLPSFSLPKLEKPKVGVLNSVDSVFIISERTRPNLQRRLASLQQQTQQLVQDISALRETEESEKHMQSKNLNQLISFLNICDKEANLNVLLKQMELYTPSVVNFLGPIPDNLLFESKHSKKSTDDTNVVLPFNEGNRPHEFIEPRVMKPISCFYCEKMIAIIGKGYVCKVCKVSVHKKCATSVKFCEPLLVIPKLPTAPPESIPGSPPQSSLDTMRTRFVSDLIFLESDDEFDDATSEFNDGFSEESDNGGECMKELASLYPVMSESLTSSTQCNSNVLPDILNFGSRQPIYETVDCSHPTNDAVINGTEEQMKRKSENLALLGSLYDEVQPDETVKKTIMAPIIPPRSFDKPMVPKKPIIPKFSLGSNTEETTNGDISRNLITIDSLCVDMRADVTAKRVKVPSPDRSLRSPSKPPVAKKPVLLKSSSNGNSSNMKSPIMTPIPLSVMATSSDANPSDTSNLPLHDNMYVSLYDFHGTESSYLSFSSGARLKLLEKSNDEWWHGDLNGAEGYFPSQYVMEMNKDEQVVRALYDFTKESELEISMIEGDIVVFMYEENDWSKIRSKDGEGLVPTSYLEFI